MIGRGREPLCLLHSLWRAYGLRAVCRAHSARLSRQPCGCQSWSSTPAAPRRPSLPERTPQTLNGTVRRDSSCLVVALLCFIEFVVTTQVLCCMIWPTAQCIAQQRHTYHGDSCDDTAVERKFLCKKLRKMDSVVLCRDICNNITAAAALFQTACGPSQQRAETTWIPG